jgi:hypothetical protein
MTKYYAWPGGVYAINNVKAEFDHHIITIADKVLKKLDTNSAIFDTFDEAQQWVLDHRARKLKLARDELAKLETTITDINNAPRQADTKELKNVNPIITIKTSTDRFGKQKNTIESIAGFPTTEELLKTVPEYLQGSHICVDECSVENVLCIRSGFVNIDLRENAELPVFDEYELDGLMSLINHLLCKWQDILDSPNAPKLETMKLEFSKEGYSFMRFGEKP